MCDHHPPSAGTAHYTRGIVCKGMHMHTSTYRHTCTKECMCTSVGMMCCGSWRCQGSRLGGDIRSRVKVGWWHQSDGGLDSITLGSRVRLPWQFFWIFIVTEWFIALCTDMTSSQKLHEFSKESQYECAFDIHNSIHKWNLQLQKELANHNQPGIPWNYLYWTFLQFSLIFCLLPVYEVVQS